MDLQRTVAPSGEPVSLEEARLQLRSPDECQNTLIASLVAAAREVAEEFQGRQLLTATWQWKFDRFMPVLVVPKPPLQSVSSITYIDPNGDEQVLNSSVYRVLGAGSRKYEGRIVEAYNESWPAVRGDEDGITVTFVAGYGTASDVPEMTRAAIKLLVGHLFANPEAVVVGTIASELPIGVKDLLSFERIVKV